LIGAKASDALHHPVARSERAADRREPVFILGQPMGLFVYARNLCLIRDASLRARD
jgi:hypothetical protein